MADKDTIQMIRKDITERLRDRDNHDCIEAANEIERLRKELDTRISMCDMRSEKIIELTNERDEARRKICEMEAECIVYPPCSPQQYAVRMGWDCFPDKAEADENNTLFRTTDGE